MPFTVRHALNKLSRYNGQNGSCMSSPAGIQKNLDRLNEVRQMIYESPEDFAGTTDWAIVLLSRCCRRFTLPEQMEQARAAAHCHRPIPLLSKNYEFIDIGQARWCCNTGYGGGGIGSGGGPRPGVQYLNVSESRNRTPYFVDVLPPRFRIRLTNDNDADNGTELVFACISNGRPITLRLKLNGMQGVVSDESMSDITGVTKPLTKGNVMVWSQVNNDCPSIIAEYSGRHENPRFTKYAAHGCLYREGVGNDHDHQVVIFGKKKCFPYRYEDLDALVDIESLQALKYGYLAINATEEQDDNSHVAKIKLMETHLERADHNLEVVEPMESCNVHYETALTPMTVYNPFGRWNNG